MTRLSLRIPAACLLVFASACTPGNSPEAEVDDACDAIPFAAALPSVNAIAGKPLLWKQCGVSEVSARYGHEDPETGDGEHCTIDIADTGFANPEGASAIGADTALDHGKSLTLNFSKMNVEMLVGSRKALLDEPVMLNLMGGPAALPVVGQLTTGDAYAIAVPDQQAEPGSESLLAVVNDRYAMTIECTEPVRNHDQAQAMYQPYVAALHLDKLP